MKESLSSPKFLSGMVDQLFTSVRVRQSSVAQIKLAGLRSQAKMANFSPFRKSRRHLWSTPKRSLSFKLDLRFNATTGLLVLARRGATARRATFSHPLRVDVLPLTRISPIGQARNMLAY